MQDIVIDGLGAEYLIEEHVSYCIAMQTIAQGIGSLVTNQGFILVESPEFNKKWLNNDGEPFINLSTVFKFVGIWSILTAFFSYILVDENNNLKDSIENEDSDNGDSEEKFTILETFKMMFRTVLLPNWLQFLFLVYLQRFGNNFFENTLSLKLQEDPAYDQGIMASADLWFIPVNLIVLFSIGKIDFSSQP